MCVCKYFFLSDMTQNDLCRDEDMRTTVRDPYRGKQMPEVRTNLTQPHRSLADKIEYHGGGTQAFLRRRVLWEAAHRMLLLLLRFKHALLCMSLLVRTVV